LLSFTVVNLLTRGPGVPSVVGRAGPARGSAAALIIVIVSVAIVIGPASEAAPTWFTGLNTAAMPASANQEYDSGANAVSCVSATSCTAVGSYQTTLGAGNVENPSAPEYGASGWVAVKDARGWSVRPTTAISGQPVNDLDVDFDAVNCISPGDCTAFGTGTGYPTDYATEPIAETEIKGVWSAPVLIAPPPDVTLAVDPVAISCTAAKNCTGTGTYELARGNTAIFTVRERSGTWSPAAALSLPGDARAGTSAQVGGISCVASGDCVVVGQYVSSLTTVAFAAESTAGTFARATEIDAPTSGDAPDALSALWCSSTVACVAVGSYQNAEGVDFAMAATSSGTRRWTSIAVHPGTSDATLNYVTCTTTKNCLAFGSVTDKTRSSVVSIPERAGAWSTPTSASTFAFQGSPDISCGTSDDCVVLTDDPVGTFRHARVAAWQASFSGATVLKMPSGTTNFAEGSLYGVSCPTATTCDALGTFLNTNGDAQAYVATYVNSVLVVSTPIPRAVGWFDSGAGAISCPAIGDCVVSYFVSNQYWLDAERNGVWRTPIALPTPESILSVSCASQTWCVAVGSDYGPFGPGGTGAYEGFDETFDGTSWSAPVQTPGTSHLLGVSCWATGSCEAVGVSDSGGPGYSLGVGVELLSAAWQPAAVIAPPMALDESYGVWLTGIACDAAAQCLAVGDWTDGRTFQDPITATASNGTWSAARAVAMPSNVATWIVNQGGFSAVSCADANDCELVGTYFDSDGYTQALEQTGSITGSIASTFSITSPFFNGEDPIDEDTDANGVGCMTATACVTVGDVSPYGGGYWGLLPVVSLGGDVPSPPKGVEVLAGDETLRIQWAAASGNGAPVESYQVNMGSTSCATTTTSCTISGLTNGKRYGIRVYATSALGTSRASALVTGVPTAGKPDGPPGAVTALAATSLLHGVKLTWVAPKDPGTGIADYAVCHDTGANVCVTVTTPNDVVQGLVTHDSYRFSVTTFAVDGERSRAVTVVAVAG
jgi:hypothetical protein